MKHSKEMHEHEMHNHSEHLENNSHNHEAGKDYEDDRHKGHSVKMFRDKFLISLIITIPILLLSSTFQSLLNFSFDFAGRKIILSILASIVVIYGGLPFFTGAAREIKQKISE